MTRMLLGLAAALTLIPATQAGAVVLLADVRYGGASGDGSVVYLYSGDALVPEDTDGAMDLYARKGDQLSLVSTGTDASPVFGMEAASSDGSVVFFSTKGRLTADDTDDAEDVYARSGGGLRKVTQGNTAADEYLSGISADGAFAYLTTPLALLPADTDTRFDVYELATATGQLRVISKGSGPYDASFAGAGGPHVFYATMEKVEAADTDNEVDVYFRAGVSNGLATPGSANVPVQVKGVSADGARLIFTTTEALDAADIDTTSDVYEAGPSGLVLRSPSPNNAAMAKPVAFRAMSSDGLRVVFESDERLSGLDTDSASDLYAGQGSTLTLLTGGGTAGVVFEAASASASVVVFRTTSQLLATDTDASHDIYRASAVGSVTHLVQSNGAFEQEDVEISPNGNIIAFDTEEPLTATDTDTLRDTYVRNAGGVRHASLPEAGAAPQPSHLADVTGAGIAVFGTYERLHAGDTDDFYDVYEFLGSTTTKISPEPIAPPAPEATPAGEPQTVAAGHPTTSTTTTAAADRTPPRIWRVRAARTRRHLAVAFVIDEVAALRVVVERKVGRRWVKVKAKRVAGHLGRHTVVLAVKRLRPGMRVVVTARDAAGNRARRALSLRG